VIDGKIRDSNANPELSDSLQVRRHI